MSPEPSQTGPPRLSPRRALIRYVAAATLARTASGGGAVAVVSAALDPGLHIHRDAAVGGLLAALLTAPYLFGPWLGSALDRAGDGRVLLAASFAGYGLALAAGVAVLGHAPLLVAAALVLAAGFGGPLLTGGLSSRLATLTEDSPPARRRAEGWDTVTYGIGNTLGPAVVAVSASQAGSLAAVVLLAVAAGVAAAVVTGLPRGEDDRAPDAAEDENVAPAYSGLATLRLLLVNGPLRRVTLATSLTAVSTGSMTLIAVVLGRQLSSQPAAGGSLAAAVGLGNLATSLAITAFPLRGEPELLIRRCTMLIGAAMAVCALMPTLAGELVAFTVVGASTAPQFAAGLAARSNYAPPGARAQVFVSMASIKMAMATLGTAVVGVTIGVGPRWLLTAGAAVVFAVVLVMALDRRLAKGHPSPRPAGSPTPIEDLAGSTVGRFHA